MGWKRDRVDRVPSLTRALSQHPRNCAVPCRAPVSCVVLLSRKVEAEAVPEVSERLEIATVPTFVLLKVPLLDYCRALDLPASTMLCAAL